MGTTGELGNVSPGGRPNSQSSALTNNNIRLVDGDSTSRPIRKAPSWISAIGKGLLKAAIVLGAVVSGAVALGLLPITIIGLILISTSIGMQTTKKQNIQFHVGQVLAGPAVISGLLFLEAFSGGIRIFK